VNAHPDIIQSFFLIFTDTAVLVTVSLYTRQPLLAAYITLAPCSDRIT
jgi:hypothetical protein|tara:strand:+ start:1280 stop:1423 length:144 start_codon:yes stop_codon:yes gene_type:complete